MNRLVTAWEGFCTSTILPFTQWGSSSTFLWSSKEDWLCWGRLVAWYLVSLNEVLSDMKRKVGSPTDLMRRNRTWWTWKWITRWWLDIGKWKGAVKVPTQIIWIDQNTILCVIHVRWTGQEVLFHGYRNTSRLHIDQASYHPVAVFQTNKIVEMFSRHMFLYFLNVYSSAIFSIAFVLCVFLAAQSSQEG